MKIEFTEYREIPELRRTVKPGDTMTAPADAPAELLELYVAAGIAEICNESGVKSGVDSLASNSSPLTNKGE
jgi:hypothetical protein